MNCFYSDGRDSFLSDEEVRRSHFISECELADFICRLLDFVELAGKGGSGLDSNTLLDVKQHPQHPIMKLADFLRNQSW
jgi:hypothetical protein